MQLHYSSMVLVAITWTIFIDDLAAQTSEHHSRIPQLESFVYPQKSQRNVNTINDGIWIRSKANAMLPLHSTGTRTIMKVMVDNDVTNAPEAMFGLTTSTSISHKGTGTTNALQKTTYNDVYGETDSTVLQPGPNLSSLGLKKTTTVQYDSNKNSNGSKRSTLTMLRAGKMVDATVDHHTVHSTESPTIKIKYFHRALKLGRVSPSSNALIQSSRLNSHTNGIDPSPSHTSELSTAKYPGSEAELFSTYSSTTDNSISSSLSIRKVSVSLSAAGNSKVKGASSKDTSNEFFSDMKIQHQYDSKKANRKEDMRNIARLVQDQTWKQSIENGTNRNTKRHTQDIGLNNTVEEWQSVERTNDISTLTSQKPGTGLVDRENVAKPINSRRKKTNRGTAISYTERYSKTSLQRKPTDRHSVPVSTGSSEALLEKPLKVPSVTSATSRRYVDTIFSTGILSDGLEQSMTGDSLNPPLRTSVSSEGWSDSHKLQDKVQETHKMLKNVQEINYPTNEKNKPDSKISAMLKNEDNVDKAPTMKSSGSSKFGETIKIMEKLKASDMKSDTRTGLSVRKFVDSIPTPDSTGLQIKNEDHNLLISRVTEPGIMMEQQLRKQIKEDNNEERKLLTLPLEKDSSPVLKNKAPAVKNLKLFLLSVGRQKEKNVLDSISSVIPQGPRKIKLPVRKLEDTPAPRKIQEYRQKLIIPSVRDVDPFSFLQPAAKKNNGERVTEENPKDSTGSTDRPIGVDMFLSSGSSNSYRDQEEQDCSNTGIVDASFPVQRCNRKRSGVSGPGTGRIKASGDVVVTVINPDGQRKRKRWKNRIADLQMTASKSLVGILLKDQRDAIMNVTRANFLHEVSLDVKTNDKTSVESLRPVNYIPNVRIDVSTINRLKLRDSTVVNDEALELRRKIRDHITGEKLVAIESCETCKIIAIVPNTTISEPSRYIDGGGSDEDHSENEKIDDTGKIEQSLRAFQTFKNTIHGGLTKVKRKTVAPEFGSRHDSVVASLARPSARFKLIDLSRPEARVGGTMHQKKSGILVRGRESIFIKQETDNSIISDEQVANQRLSSVKLDIPEATVPSMLGRLDESVENGLFSERYVGTPQSSFIMNSQPYGELRHEPLFSGITENFVTTRTSRFSNDAEGIPKDYGNFRTHATPRIGSGRARKSIGHHQTTESSTSSTKTDSSTWPIDMLPYRIIHVAGKAPQPHSHFGLSATNHQDGIPSNNVIAKEINTGFTSVESPSITVTMPASRRLYEHVEPAIVALPEVRDIKSTVTIIRTTDRAVTGSDASVIFPSIDKTGQSSRRPETHSQTIAPVQVVELSNEKPIILNAGNHDQEIMQSLERGKSLIINGRASANFQPNRNIHPPANSAIGIATDNNTFGYNGNDNSTRITATLNQWPVKYSAVVEGDLVVGGLMMVHEREDSITCGPVMPQGGVQALEAMLYTLDWVNKRDLVPGVKIGAHILDDCDKDTYGLEMAVDFIKGFHISGSNFAYELKVFRGWLGL